MWQPSQEGSAAGSACRVAQAVAWRVWIQSACLAHVTVAAGGLLLGRGEVAEERHCWHRVAD